MESFVIIFLITSAFFGVATHSKAIVDIISRLVKVSEELSVQEKRQLETTLANYVFSAYNINIRLFGYKLFTRKSLLVSFFFSLIFFILATISAVALNYVLADGKLIENFILNIYMSYPYSVIILPFFAVVMMTIDWVCCEKSRFIIRKIRPHHSSYTVIAVLLFDFITSTVIFIALTAMYVTVFTEVSSYAQMSPENKSLISSYSCYVKAGGGPFNLSSGTVENHGKANEKLIIKSMNAKLQDDSTCQIDNASLIELVCSVNSFKMTDTSEARVNVEIDCGNREISDLDKSRIISASIDNYIKDNRFSSFLILIRTYSEFAIDHLRNFPKTFILIPIDNVYIDTSGEKYYGPWNEVIRRIPFPFTAFMVSSYLTSIWIFIVAFAIFTVKVKISSLRSQDKLKFIAKKIDSYLVIRLRIIMYAISFIVLVFFILNLFIKHAIR